MAKIFIPPCNEYREINQIVSFGCSMTHGAELLDQLRYPEVPDIEAKKRELGTPDNWYSWQQKNWKKYGNGSPEDIIICDQERQLAWPAQFAKLYNIPCYNYAEGASSFEKQISQFMLAKHAGKITPQTLVLWGFTASSRGPWFQLDNWNMGWMLNGMMNPDGNYFPKEATQFWFDRVNSPIMLLWKYYMCLQTVFALANEECNDQFLFTQAITVDLDYDKMPYTFQLPYRRPEFIVQMREWFKIIDPKYQKYRIFNDDRNIFFDWTGKPESPGRLGGSHPTLESHQKYAQLIAEELDNKSRK